MPRILETRHSFFVLVENNIFKTLKQSPHQQTMYLNGHVSTDFVIPMLQQNCFQISIRETTSSLLVRKGKEKSMAANTRTTTTTVA